ncbi:MAG TPA: tripartite tricarboxylate transporter TctB family protein [Casimicrobiaceae bacterium]
MLERLKATWPYAALFVGAAYLFHDAGTFAAAARPGQLGPDFWPRAVLVLLMIVCAYEVVRRVVFARDVGAEVSNATDTVADQPAQSEVDGSVETREPEARYPWRLAVGIGLTIAYVLLLDVLGFFVTTALFLGFFMIAGRYYRTRVVALASIVGSLVFVFVFMKIVYVSPPLGVGPFRTFSVWLLAMLGIR